MRRSCKSERGAVWLLLVLLMAGAAEARVAYLGASVHDFSWRNKLIAWRHSRQLLDTVAGAWLQAAEGDRQTLDNPTRAALQSAIGQFQIKLAPDDLLVFYLGTHHLKNGHILLAEDESCSAADLNAWLAPLRCRTLLLADVCYAERIEPEAGFSDRIMRVYASNSKQAAPDLDLDGDLKSLNRFFAETAAIIAELGVQETAFSMMATVMVHALSELRQQQNALTAATLFSQMAATQEALRRETRRLSRTPELVVANSQPWPLLAPAATPQPPAAGERNLTAATLDELLALPEEQLDVGYGCLLIGRIYDPEMVIGDYLQQLDEMAAELRAALPVGATAQESVAVLNDFLFADRGFTADVDPYPEDFLLHRLLDTGHGRCSALVSLYLALGERLGLPLHSVCVPEHTYVRLSADGTRINIETTRRGAALDDAVYLQKCGDQVTEKGKSFYLQPQTRRQMLGALLSPLSSALRQQQRLAEAVDIGKTAIGINPNDAEAWNNLGMAYRQREDLQLAILAYRRAVAIKPDFAAAWNNQGSAATDPAERVRCYQQAVACDARLAVAWRNLARAHFDNGSYQLSLACVKRSHALGAALPAEFLDQLREKLAQ